MKSVSFFGTRGKTPVWPMSNQNRSPTESSAAELLTAWQAGDEHAAAILFERYVVRLTALVRSRLAKSLTRRVDAEDIVMSAWRSFFVRARGGSLTVGNEISLWHLLATITLRKLSRQVRLHTAAQRSVEIESADDPTVAFRPAIAEEPAVEHVVMMTEEILRVINSLGELDAQIASQLLQGRTVAQIVSVLKCSDRTVRRTLEHIRRSCESEFGNSPDTSGLAEFAAERILRILVRANSSPTLSDAAQTVPTHRYTDLLLQELIGEGGFSKVFRAIDRTTGKTVAVKFLRRALWKDPDSALSIRREYAILRTIRHPGILRVDGWGSTPAGAIFLISELLEGETLDVWQTSANRSITEITKILAQIGTALQAAHLNGLIHGDLKPQNVVRLPNGQTVVLDFGMARWFQSIDDRPPVGGTTGFLSPEQISPAFGDISFRTDVYALGALAWTLLTGHPPMAGRDLSETITNVLSAKRPKLPASVVAIAPISLCCLIEQCLSLEPIQRPPTLYDVVRSLELPGDGMQSL